MEIKVTEEFMRCIKPMAKRYRSFKQDYNDLLDELEENPHAGVDLGNGFRKVRMAIRSKGKGKSGGARVITFDTMERNGILYLIYAYDKSDSSNVEMSVIKELIRQIEI